MYTQHAVVGRLIVLRVVVRRNECVVMLSPHEDVVPVTQIISNHRQTISPSLHDGLHVVQGTAAPVQQGLVDLRSLLQLHDLSTPEHGNRITLTTERIVYT